MKTDLMEIGANSTLLVAKVNKTDSGNYSCSIGESQPYAVLVHVLNGKIICLSCIFLTFSLHFITPGGLCLLLLGLIRNCEFI